MKVWRGEGGDPLMITEAGEVESAPAITSAGYLESRLHRGQPIDSDNPPPAELVQAFVTLIGTLEQEVEAAKAAFDVCERERITYEEYAKRSAQHNPTTTYPY